MGFLEDFQASLESLPAMLQRNYGLIRELDTSLQASQQQNEQRCEQEIEEIKRGIESGNVAPDMSLIRFSGEALEEQKHCIRVADEKVALASQAYDMSTFGITVVWRTRTPHRRRRKSISMGKQALRLFCSSS